MEDHSGYTKLASDLLSESHSKTKTAKRIGRVIKAIEMQARTGVDTVLPASPICNEPTSTQAPAGVAMQKQTSPALVPTSEHSGPADEQVKLGTDVQRSEAGTSPLPTSKEGKKHDGHTAVSSGNSQGGTDANAAMTRDSTKSTAGTRARGTPPSPPNNPAEDRLGFAIKDYEIVHREILDIKACRTNVFMGTLALMGAVGVAILGIIGTADSSSWQLWLPFASAIPVGFLSCSILCTVHKARGINERSGYMEALSEYLVRGTTPPYYCGWLKALHVRRRCSLYDRMRQRGHLEGENDPTCKADIRCEKKAKDLTAKAVADIPMMPAFLDNFTSLSAHIYAVAYVLSVIGLLVAVMRTSIVMAKETTGSFKPGLYWLGVGIGATITGILVMVAIWTRCRSAQTENQLERKATRMEQVLRWYKGIAGFLLPLGVFAALILTAYPRLAAWAVVVAYVLGGIIAATAVSVAYSFYDKLRSLRRGRYSPEQYRHIWKIRFQRCPLMAKLTAHE